LHLQSIDDVVQANRRGHGFATIILPALGNSTHKLIGTS
jgi:hypothetical protein